MKKFEISPVALIGNLYKIYTVMYSKLEEVNAQKSN